MSNRGAIFRFLYAILHVIREAIATMQMAHARYLISWAIKTLRFGAGSKSVTIDNAVLGTLPKRLLLTMLRNANFTGSRTLTSTSKRISISSISSCT